jgi:dihydroneopterin aldolase/2-amino-4-hydroxy-6-hydroxymethyldihydropteridine diphosphokinase
MECGNVSVRGLTVTGCHGVHEFEKTSPQRFVFDVDMQVDFAEAAKNDDLNGTVSYSDVCRLISKITTENTFNLIEKLADVCARRILNTYPKVRAIALTVHKPDAPIGMPFDSVAVTVKRKREEVYLALGSSMGDKKKMLDFAVESLGKTEGITVQSVSSYYETEPYGGVAKNTFLNGAARVMTYLSPYELLDEIHRIEAEGGRVRKVHWEDRPLDIDIIFFGQEVLHDDRLTIPHPEWNKREFVLKPLKEVAPHFVPPTVGDLVNKY